jgi:hypothetical protein
MAGQPYPSKEIPGRNLHVLRTGFELLGSLNKWVTHRLHAMDRCVMINLQLESRAAGITMPIM